MKNILLLLIVPALMLSGCSQKTTGSITAPTKGIYFTNDSFDKVMAQAEAQSKPVFIDFYTTWCAPCKWLEKDVFELQQVGDYFNDNFISVKIDAEKGEGPDIASRYNVYGYPTIVYLDSQGNVINQHVGMTSSSHVMTMARQTVDANNDLTGSN